MGIQVERNELSDSLAELVDAKRLERLLSVALERGGDFAEVFCERAVSTAIPLDEDRIKSAETRRRIGVGIRVIVGQQQGYGYSDDLSPDALINTAKVAASIAHASSDARVSLKAQSVPSFSTIERDYDLAPMSDKVSLVRRANEAAHQHDPRILQVQAHYFDSKKEVLIANSEGLLLHDHQNMVRMFVVAVASDGKETQMGFSGGGGRLGMEYFDTVMPESIAAEAARQAIVQIGAADAPAGAMPVVIEGGWGGVWLHEAVGHGLEADFNRKGTSIYSNRIGQKVASECCTVVDDATLANKRGSINMDDEGARGQRKVLIERGVLRGYMTDRLNAQLMGLSCTGNGRRESYEHVPMPRMTNTFLEPGEYNPDEIIGSVKSGFYAKGISGGQVDISNGNFVFSVTEGYLIEEGKIGRPVKNATLIGNGPDCLAKVVKIGANWALDPGIGTCGKNGQSVPVGVGMPMILVSEMVVGGTGLRGATPMM